MGSSTIIPGDVAPEEAGADGPVLHLADVVEGEVQPADARIKRLLSDDDGRHRINFENKF